ncbi:hypothetical protein FEM48_Zijuj10G0124300 [Ziziphus jujuba var. spinosa]|uniref:Pentatricopeptide repeat-containing protein n=1 Tax=Ziziphus jujuba var. spinosa TaxID=714518 RepID=A0A978UND5_ZIZJJ|nr:hypothetical protein FEM48_Zijuj10G0124300 [Ziziphus jujuba var. spinosa]
MLWRRSLTTKLDFFFTSPSKFQFSTLVHNQESSFQPLPLTKEAFAEALQSCRSHTHQLKQIHGLLLTTGLSIKNSLLTCLLSNLTVLGNMSYARKLFDDMHKPRIFLWNTLIKGYSKNRIFVEAVLVYREMRLVGVRPDSFTFPFVVKACGELPEKWIGEFHVFYGGDRSHPQSLLIYEKLDQLLKDMRTIGSMGLEAM